ncbi:MAG: hypothetical protein AB8E82_03370 [Aureispira sp.]
MQPTTKAIIAALKILKKENPNSAAIALLEDALKHSMKHYIMNMAAMGAVVELEDIEQELKNGLKLLDIFNKKSIN